MKRGVLIHPDGHVGIAVINEEQDFIKQLSQIIGGWVTEWHSSIPNLSFWCDEDGLLKKLPVNQLATSILDEGLGSAPAVGIFVVMGATENGDPAGLTVEQANIFLSADGEDIINRLIYFGNEEMGLDYLEED
jgi:hypothetical protein